MPDAVVIDAGRTILDAGVIGAALLLCMAALVWVVRQWLTAQRTIDTLQESRLAEAKEYASLGTEMKTTMQANTAAMQTLVETMRGRR